MKVTYSIFFLAAVLATETSFAATPFGFDDFVQAPEFLNSNIEIQKHEVTYAQWDVLNAKLPIGNQSPWKAANCMGGISHVPKAFGLNFPAACISWDDAHAYIQTLNALDSFYQYRLMTAAEFYLLAGRSLNSARPNGPISEEILAHYAWYAANSNDRAHESCTRTTVFGLCDVLGNLLEMTQEKWREQWDRGPLKSVSYGGSWDHWAVDPFYYTLDLPDSRSSTRGFRLVRVKK